MKDIIEHGPLQVSMHMYEDFRVYTRGISDIFNIIRLYIVRSWNVNFSSVRKI